MARNPNLPEYEGMRVITKGPDATHRTAELATAVGVCGTEHTPHEDIHVPLLPTAATFTAAATASVAIASANADAIATADADAIRIVGFIAAARAACGIATGAWATIDTVGFGGMAVSVEAGGVSALLRTWLSGCQLCFGLQNRRCNTSWCHPLLCCR